MISTVPARRSFRRLFGWVVVAAVAVPQFACQFVHAADWPQFLGPNRNGVVSEAVAVAFKGGSPARLWKYGVGQGFAGPAVEGNRVIVFHRVDNQEVTEALDAKTGSRLWHQDSPTAYTDDFGFDEGPRAVPTVSAGRIFTHGAEGRLECRSLEDGKRLWAVDTRTRFGSDKGFFGIACAPLVIGDRVFLNLGGRNGAGVAAFSATNGEVLWKVTDDEAGYASPVAWPGSNPDAVLFFTRTGLRAVDAVSGKLRLSHPWRARTSASVNAASPIAAGNEVLLTASYGTGATLLRLKDDAAESVWSGDDILSAHYATPVKLGGLVFGFHGRQESGPTLRCIEWATGKVRWESDTLPAGTVAVAGDQLVVLLESGELMIVPATAEGFHPKVRCQIMGSGLRAPFALSDGILYARDKSSLAAFDLRP